MIQFSNRKVNFSSTSLQGTSEVFAGHSFKNGIFAWSKHPFDMVLQS